MNQLIPAFSKKFKILHFLKCFYAKVLVGGVAGNEGKYSGKMLKSPICSNLVKDQQNKQRF